MDKKTKKIITEEWLRAFPDLSAYDQNKLYKIIGAFICGIELINLPRSENYRPHFVIYSLYKNNIKSCLEYPTLMFEFYDNKKLQLNLPYNDANGRFKDAQNIVSNKLHVSLEGNVLLNSFYMLIDDVQKNDATYHNHPGKIASLFELKFYAALYAGSDVELNAIISQIQEASKSWNMQMFEIWYGKFDLWFQSLQEKISEREEFLKQIETNKLDKKISKLKNSEIIL